MERNVFVFSLFFFSGLTSKTIGNPRKSFNASREERKLCFKITSSSSTVATTTSTSTTTK